jgi:hypothetical protein
MKIFYGKNLMTFMIYLNILMFDNVQLQNQIQLLGCWGGNRDDDKN